MNRVTGTMLHTVTVAAVVSGAMLGVLATGAALLAMDAMTTRFDTWSRRFLTAWGAGGATRGVTPAPRVDLERHPARPTLRRQAPTKRGELVRVGLELPRRQRARLPKRSRTPE